MKKHDISRPVTDESGALLVPDWVRVAFDSLSPAVRKVISFRHLHDIGRAYAAGHTLRWTTEPPTEPGWYWWRKWEGSEWMRLVESLPGDNGELSLWNGEDYVLVSSMTDSQWAGPIPEPSE